MVNRDNGDSAYCFLSQTANYVSTMWIQNINYVTGRIDIIRADGGFTFYLSSFDRDIYSNWIPGERVFFGRNTRWNQSTSPYIIINIDSLTIARGSAN